jgi:hypothetical protein
MTVAYNKRILSEFYGAFANGFVDRAGCIVAGDVFCADERLIADIFDRPAIPRGRRTAQHTKPKG